MSRPRFIRLKAARGQRKVFSLQGTSAGAALRAATDRSAESPVGANSPLLKTWAKLAALTKLAIGLVVTSSLAQWIVGAALAVAITTAFLCWPHPASDQVTVTSSDESAGTPATLPALGVIKSPVVPAVSALAPPMAATSNDQPASDPSRDLERFLHEGSENFRAALDLLHGQASNAHPDLETHLLSRWADKDLSAAAAWARDLSEPTQKSKALLAIANEAARTQPASALGIISGLPAGDQRDDLITRAVGEWAVADPKAAAAWAAQIDSDQLRNEALARVASTWADSDPTNAAVLARNELAPGKTQDDAMMGIVQRWAEKEPELAAEWVERFPAGSLRTTALGELVKLWSDQDSEKAGQWLDGLAAGSDRDLTVGAYVNKIAPKFPSVAAQWAISITEESLRVKSLESVGESWMLTEPAGAKAWIATSDLPSPSKLRLLAIKSEPSSL